MPSLAPSPLSTSEAPFPTKTYAGGCCGAFSVNIEGSDVNTSEFMKMMENIRFPGYVHEKCTLGLMIIQNPLPKKHRIVQEILKEAPRGWQAIPFGEKYWVFWVVEAARMPRFPASKEINGKGTGAHSEIGKNVYQIINLYTLPSVKGIKTAMVYSNNIYYAILPYTSQDGAYTNNFDYNTAWHYAFKELGFVCVPFIHRVHSGEARRMLLEYYIPRVER